MGIRPMPDLLIRMAELREEAPDIVMADAYAKNINDGINWEDGFKAMVQCRSDRICL